MHRDMVDCLDALHVFMNRCPRAEPMVAAHARNLSHSVITFIATRNESGDRVHSAPRAFQSNFKLMAMLTLLFKTAGIDRQQRCASLECPGTVTDQVMSTCQRCRMSVVCVERLEMAQLTCAGARRAVSEARGRSTVPAAPSSALLAPPKRDLVR